MKATNLLPCPYCVHYVQRHHRAPRPLLENGEWEDVQRWAARWLEDDGLAPCRHEEEEGEGGCTPSSCPCWHEEESGA